MSDAFYGGGSSASADPGLMQRLMQYIGGGGGGPPPDPDAAARQAAIEKLKPMMGSPGNTNAPGIMPHMFGDGPNVQGRPVLPYLNPATGPIADASRIPTNLPPQAAPPPPGGHGGIGSDANFPILGGGTGMPSSYGAPGQVPAPLPPMAPPMPPVRPKVAGGAPVRRAAPAGRIPPSATASVPPAAGGMWDLNHTYQNRDITGGALSRDGGRQMGMIDLSKLFSRQ